MNNMAKVKWGHPTTINDFQNTKPNEASPRIAFIGSLWMYDSLSSCADILQITPKNYKVAFDCFEFEVLLVESFIEKSETEWQYFEHVNSPHYNVFVDLIEYAAECAVPTVFWQTQGAEYCDSYSSIVPLFKRVYFADPKAKSYYSLMGISAWQLAPCVNPHKFNPYKAFSECDKGFEIVIDGLSGLIQNKQPWESLLSLLIDSKISIYDSKSVIYRNNITQLALTENIEIIGEVDELSRRELLKRANIYLDVQQSGFSEIRKCWRRLEAAASGALVITVDSDEAYSSESIGIHVNSEEQLLRYIQMFQEDPMLLERMRHKFWRNAITLYSIQDRVETILSDLNIVFSKPISKKASLIFQTKRPENFNHVLLNYEKQSYLNKELIVVVNSNAEQYQSLKSQVEYRQDIQVLYMPDENFFGACMILGASVATGSYVFRFDDHTYGANYIKDLMLHLSYSGADFIGKQLLFYCEDYEPNLSGSVQKRLASYSLLAGKDLQAAKASLSGSTLGGKTQTFLDVPYVDAVAAVDNDWILGFENIGKFGLLGDPFNAVPCRRTNTEQVYNSNLTLADMLV